MEIITSLFLLICLILITHNMNKKKVYHKELSLKDLIKKTFPKHHIIDKNQTIMICDFDIRNEPDELAFIRLNPNKKKSIEKLGRRIVINYQKMPSSKELKNDLPHIK
jgi:hypothetical protein